MNRRNDCLHLQRAASSQRASSPNASTIGAVVLAAGSASRIGHRPKCLLELDGEPLLGRLLRAISTAGIDEIVVVLGHYAAQIEPMLANFAATCVHNEEPDAGQNSSLHCGLRALSPVDAILIMLADQPLLDANDIGALIKAFRQRPAATDMVVPTLGDLPGNPVAFDAGVRAEILARDIQFGGRQWQHENRDRVYRWATTNENYRVDIDTLADIDAFAARTGFVLQWPAALA